MAPHILGGMILAVVPHHDRATPSYSWNSNSRHVKLISVFTPLPVRFHTDKPVGPSFLVLVRAWNLVKWRSRLHEASRQLDDYQKDWVRIRQSTSTYKVANKTLRTALKVVLLIMCKRPQDNIPREKGRS